MENGKKDLELLITNHLKQNDNSVCDVELVLTKKNYEMLVSWLQHTISDNDKRKLATKKFITYKRNHVDPITGETQIVENVITVDAAIKLMAQKVFTTEELHNAMTASINNKHNVRQKLAKIGSKQGQQLRAIKSGSKIVSSTIELAVPLSDSKYTQADKFFYSWWVKDENSNVYLKTKDNKLILLPLKENGEGKISGNNEFWTLFWKNYRDCFTEWENRIRNICRDMFDNIQDDTQYYDVMNPAIECHKVVPKFFLQCLSLCITQTEETETKTIEDPDTHTAKEISYTYMTVSDISPKIKIGKGENGQVTTLNETSMKSVFMERMAELDKSEIQLMVRFSNVLDPTKPAFYVIQKDLWEAVDATCVDENGNPAMPETWKKFLMNKFKIDKAEQLYRLASFMMSVVDANNFSRQALVICGEGNDGKSTFINAVTKFFNSYTNARFVESCTAEGFMPGEKQNGFVKCLDSRLITIGDVQKPSTLINTDAFKQITGCDEITCPKKYCDPVTKNMAGVKMLIATNDKVYLENDFATTRVIPMYFSPRDKNVPDFDMKQLENDLVVEMPQFLKWCNYYNNAIKQKYGIPNNQTKIFKFDGTKNTKECFETLYSKDRKFHYNTKDEYASEDEAVFDQFIDEYFELTPTGELKRSDLLIYWATYAESEQISDVYKMRPKSQDFKNLLNRIRQRGFDLDMNVNVNFTTTRDGKTVRLIKGLRVFEPSATDFSEPLLTLDDINNM